MFHPICINVSINRHYFDYLKMLDSTLFYERLFVIDPQAHKGVCNYTTAITLVSVRCVVRCVVLLHYINTSACTISSFLQEQVVLFYLKDKWVRQVHCISYRIYIDCVFKHNAQTKVSTGQQSSTRYFWGCSCADKVLVEVIQLVHCANRSLQINQKLRPLPRQLLSLEKRSVDMICILLIFYFYPPTQFELFLIGNHAQSSCNVHELHKNKPFYLFQNFRQDKTSGISRII